MNGPDVVVAGAILCAALTGAVAGDLPIEHERLVRDLQARERILKRAQVDYLVLQWDREDSSVALCELVRARFAGVAEKWLRRRADLRKLSGHPWEALRKRGLDAAEEPEGIADAVAIQERVHIDVYGGARMLSLSPVPYDNDRWSGALWPGFDPFYRRGPMGGWAFIGEMWASERVAQWRLIRFGAGPDDTERWVFEFGRNDDEVWVVRMVTARKEGSLPLDMTTSSLPVEKVDLFLGAVLDAGTDTAMNPLGFETLRASSHVERRVEVEGVWYAGTVRAELPHAMGPQKAWFRITPRAGGDTPAIEFDVSRKPVETGDATVTALDQLTGESLDFTDGHAMVVANRGPRRGADGGDDGGERRREISVPRGLGPWLWIALFGAGLALLAAAGRRRGRRVAATE